MAVGFLDSHPTLYVVHRRAKLVLCGPQEKPHTGIDDCLRIIQPCHASEKGRLYARKLMRKDIVSEFILNVCGCYEETGTT